MTTDEKINDRISLLITAIGVCFILACGIWLYDTVNQSVDVKATIQANNPITIIKR